MQLFLVATAGLCQASPSGIPIAKSVFRNLKFSDDIVEKAEPLYIILKVSKVHLNVEDAQGLLDLLKSSWGIHLNPDTDFSLEDRGELDERIQEMGLRNIYREQSQFTHQPNINSLMIYLGAHPSVLCRSLSDVRDLSRHVHHTLIVAASQDYKKKDFDTDSCAHLKLSHAPFLSMLPAQSNLQHIMATYLQGFGVDINKISYAPNFYTDMNNSARLRLYLKHNPRALKLYNKIIIIAPQPHGEEAWLTVKKYTDSNVTTVSRLFSLPEVYLKNDLMALRSLLEADLELKDVRPPQ